MLVSAAAVSPAVYGGGRHDIYVASTPFRATKNPAKLLFSSAYSLRVWRLQHFMLVIKPSAPPPLFEAVVFDFQPKDPENIIVALSALSGQSIPGAILVRKISYFPRGRCWLVGSSKANALEEAHKFNSRWETDLKIGQHDCRDYVNGLVELLTGETNVIERLRRERAIAGEGLMVD